jgi:hypothetical protein
VVTKDLAARLPERTASGGSVATERDAQANGDQDPDASYRAAS